MRRRYPDLSDQQRLAKELENKKPLVETRGCKPKPTAYEKESCTIKRIKGTKLLFSFC
jgi:hypothetical protein